MNREILFRGKNLKNKWVYGHYLEADRCNRTGRKPHKAWIVEHFAANGGWLTPLVHHAVQEETVGQYTGLKDKNGTKIFEGDILRAVRRDLEKICHVEYIGYSFYVPELHWDLSDAAFDYQLEIIGNIYNNPELLRME